MAKTTKEIGTTNEGYLGFSFNRWGCITVRELIAAMQQIPEQDAFVVLAEDGEENSYDALVRGQVVKFIGDDINTHHSANVIKDGVVALILSPRG